MKLKVTNLLLALILSVGIASAQFTTDGIYAFENFSHGKFIDVTTSGGNILVTTGTSSDFGWIVKQNGDAFNIMTLDEASLLHSTGSTGQLIDNTEENRNSTTAGALVSFTSVAGDGSAPFFLQSNSASGQRNWNGNRNGQTQLGMGASTATHAQWTLIRLGDLPSSGITWTGATDSDWNTATNWSGGVVPTSADDVIIPDASTVVVSGDAAANDLTVDVGATLTVMSGASLAIMGSATGDATMVRNTTGNGGYSIVGAPVSGADLSTLAADWLYDYDGANWVAMSSGSMSSGKGYFAGYATVGEVVLSGALVSGNVSAAVSTAGDGFNILANPYAAAITAQDVLDSDNSAQATTGAVYIWNDGGANNGADRVGSYAVKNNLDGNDFTTIGSVQGFFVQASTGGSIDFTPMMQSTDAGANADGNFYRKANSTEKQILKLSISGNDLFQTTTIGFVADASFGRDYGYDAQYLPGNDLISFYSMLENEKMAIQGLPQQENIEVLLGMDLKEAGSYKVTVETFEGFGELPVVLIDQETGLTYDLSKGVEIPFTTGALVSASRFKVAVAPAKVLSNVSLTDKLQVFGTSSDLTIAYASDKAEIVNIYSLDGRSVFSNEVLFSNNKAVIAAAVNRNQVYVLRVNNEAVKFVLK